MSDVTSPPTRRALLIGIDAYAAMPSVITPLSGCVNDVTAMARVLGAPPYAFEHVRVLTNEAATRDGILAALDDLVRDTGTDDIVVIQYAGHGSQKWNADATEASGWDSTLVPVDSARKPLPNRDITDKEINARLEALGKKTAYTTLFVDSCHSGTITRDAFDVKSRGVAPDPPDAAEAPGGPAGGAATRSAGPARTRGVGKRAAEQGDAGSRYVVISGCRDEETSWEYVTPPEEGNVKHGAMTYFLLRELVKPGRKSYRDVFEAIAPVVTAYKGQHPQLEGRSDGEVLGVGVYPPMEYVPVTAVSADGVVLAAGAAHRVTVGSEYDVFRPATKQADEAAKVGRVRVTAVHAVHADAVPMDGTAAGAIEVGARAVEAVHAYSPSRLRVWLDDSVAGAEGEMLRRKLASSRKIEVVDAAEGAHLRVALLRPGATGAVPRLGSVDAPTWAMVDGRGELVGPLKPAADVEQLAKNLALYANYRDTLTLENTKEPSALRGTVTLEALRQVPDAAAPKGFRWEAAVPESPGGAIVFEEGDRVAFRVTNHHTEPLFVNVLVLGSDGSLDVVHPRPKDAVERVGTERAFNIWRRDGSGFPVSIPAGFPYLPGDTTSEVVDVIKLVATQREARFESLVQEGMRSAAARSAVEGLMQRAIGGLDDDAPLDAKVAEEDWTTAELRIVTRRKGAAPLAHATAASAATAAPAAVSGAPSVPNAPSLPAGLAVALGIGAAGRDAAERAVAGAGLGVQHAFEVVQTPVAPGQRAVAERRVEVPAPPEGFGQMLLTTDADGVVSWHFAQAGDGGRAAGDGMRAYALPAPTAAPAEPGQRSIVGVGIRKLVEVIVFPIVEEHVGALGVSAMEWWEGRNRPYRLRTFTPDDYALPEGAPVDGATLADGRALLMVHGTFSRAHSAFGALPREAVVRLHAQYGGRVFAFDHFSLSHGPERNVQWLLDQLPAGATLDVDIVCHSRGGLVARTLAERHADRARVGKVVFVGAPNAGTTLADVDHVSTFIDTYTNLLAVVPPSGVADVLEGVVEVAKLLAVGVAKALPGLQAMQPKGEFLTQSLNAAGAGAGNGVRYFSMSSNYTPAPTRPGLKALLANRLMDKVFAADNDLVVPTESTFASNGCALFPIADARVFRGEDSMTHTEFFARPAAYGQILTWLGA